MNEIRWIWKPIWKWHEMTQSAGNLDSFQRILAHCALNVFFYCIWQSSEFDKIKPHWPLKMAKFVTMPEFNKFKRNFWSETASITNHLFCTNMTLQMLKKHLNNRFTSLIYLTYLFKKKCFVNRNRKTNKITLEGSIALSTTSGKWLMEGLIVGQSIASHHIFISKSQCPYTPTHGVVIQKLYSGTVSHAN